MFQDELKETQWRIYSNSKNEMENPGGCGEF